MDFSLTDEQRMIQDLAREFARSRDRPVFRSVPIATRASRWQSGKRRSKSAYLIFPCRLNTAAPAWATFEVALVTERLCRACLGIGTTLCINVLAAEPILQAGNEPQKRAYFGRFAAGEFASFALTEPGAGSIRLPSAPRPSALPVGTS